MTVRRFLLYFTAAGALAAVAAGLLFVGGAAISRPAVPEPPPNLPPPRLDATQIATGRLDMERLPMQITQALEAHSEEIVKTAEALDGKQARITGTCAPGSAIRVIAENGTVSCQHLPRGVVSVAAITATPTLSTTPTAPATVKGGVGRYQTGGDDDFLIAPVALPDGAVVTAFSYAFFDDSPDVDGAAYLYRSDAQPMAQVSTSGATNEVRIVTTEQVELKKVDAGRYSYFVYFQTSAKAGANLVPISASIFYRLP